MPNLKLRLKHPSGAEFEAEGPADFILNEKEGFLKRLTAEGTGGGAAEQRPPAAPGAAWGDIAETRNGLVILKNKHPNVKAEDAVLLLLATADQLCGTPETTAIDLSRAIKASGYMPGRLDRLLTKAMKEGLVKASGTKRNRSYQITDKGLERAWLEARKLG